MDPSGTIQLLGSHILQTERDGGSSQKHADSCPVELGRFSVPQAKAIGVPYDWQLYS